MEIVGRIKTSNEWIKRINLIGNLEINWVDLSRKRKFKLTEVNALFIFPGSK